MDNRDGWQSSIPGRPEYRLWPLYIFRENELEMMRGKTIQLYFEVATDEEYEAGTLIDDVLL